MPVDIKLLGTSNQWKLEGPRIRIGRDPGCDIPLSPERFPMVSREHLVLVMEKGHVRFTDPGSANGTYVNGVRAAQGRLLNADRIRLGSDGPELEITFIDEGTGHHPQQNPGATVVSTPVSLSTPTMASTAEAATTMMLGADGGLQKNMAAAQAAAPPVAAQPPAAPPVPPTAIAPPMPPTVVAPPPAAPPTAVAPPAMPPTVVAPGAPAGATQVVAPAGGHGQDPTRVVPAASPSTVYAPNIQPAGSSNQPTVVQQQGPQSPPPPQQQIQQRPVEDTYPTNESGMSKEQEEMIEQKVSSLNKMVMLLAVMVIVLLGLVFYLEQQIQKTHDAVIDLTRKSQDAVAQLQPQVDQRMKALDTRIDSFDGKMKDAENHMVNRMNAELPVMLDKYVDRKMKQLNSQAGQLTPQ